MTEQTFSLWLKQEVLTAQNALLAMYEKLDALRFVERPKLEREYMEKVGASEAQVIREEIECEVLEKKQQLIQTAINRRQPIDEDAINQQVDAYRETLLHEAEGADQNGTADPVMQTVAGMPVEYAQLSGEESKELQTVYHEILKNYHPQTHPEMTAAQKELFEKAQLAYRQQNLEALKLSAEILQSSKETSGISISFEVGLTLGSGSETVIEISPDYSLAARLFPFFQPTEAEIVMGEEIQRCRDASEKIASQIKAASQKFPFSAKEMLADPEQLQEYIGELNQRLHTAGTKRKAREAAIQKMIEGAKKHG